VDKRLHAVRRMCVLAAVVASVAGCVNMPSNGPAEEFTASPQTSAPEGNLVGVVPSGPQPGENPSQIVQGFLTASASYPSYAVALEYLTSSAVKTWEPSFAVTVFSSLTVPDWVPAPKADRNVGQHASVLVSGAVQACFNGSGQYVSAQCQGQPSGAWNADLVKVGGQWRIANPPNSRMLLSSVFSLFYKAQDLYFFDSPLDQVLVPDSVFVPLGATVSQLVANLVSALAQDPKTQWLEGATDTELPPGTKVQQVTTDGSTAIVNLGGDVAKASTKQLQLFAAQLVWTLTGSPPGPLSIQAVMLELNGVPWAPRSAPCANGPKPGLQQTRAAYECFDPYPSSPASFYYVDRGQSWARCGSEAFGKQGSIGAVVPVVGRTGRFTSQRCDDTTGSVREGYAGLPSLQSQSLPAVSRAAVSPDGKYLAIVTAGKGYVYVGSMSGRAASFPSTPRLTQGGVTALSWDRNDDLWVVQNGNIAMLPPTGKGEIQVAFNGTVSDLRVAPDGVRIAFIAQLPGAPGPGIFLAAIGSGGQNSVQLGTGGTHLSIRSYAPVGPNLSGPSSLAWYDADDLIVVADAPTAGNALWEAPVDGQQATQQVAPPNVTSITAAGDQNVLVAGLSGNNLAVSTSLEGQWYQLGESGAEPAYPG
jgi:Lipoprotein LpqB beta-propeller domain/Sporulation and spore germination